MGPPGTGKTYIASLCLTFAVILGFNNNLQLASICKFIWNYFAFYALYSGIFSLQPFWMKVL